MEGIIELGILAFLSAVLVFIGYTIKSEFDDDGKNMFLFGMFILILSVFGMGVLVSQDEVKQVKHKVVPVIKVECMNSKCDTTYIYTFKENK